MVALPTSSPDAYARVNRLCTARSATSAADSGSVGMILLWIDRQSSSSGPVAAMISKGTAQFGASQPPTRMALPFAVDRYFGSAERAAASISAR